jgi:hypothetical protein
LASSTFLGGAGTYDTIKNWDQLSTPEKITAITFNSLMLLPAAITVGRGSIRAGKFVFETNEATRQRTQVDAILESNKQKFIEALAGTDNSQQIISKYNKFLDDVKEYGQAQLELEQARFVVNEIKFARTAGELALLNRAKATIARLEGKIGQLEDKVTKSGDAYADSLEGNIKVDDPSVFNEAREIPRRSIADIRRIAQEIVKPRTIKEIKADIDKAIRETAGLEAGAKINPKALITQTDYLNALNRELYFARLSELNKIYMKALKGDLLAKAVVSQLGKQNITTITPAQLQKTRQSLAGIKSKMAETKGEFFKGIESTTESVAGRETYAGVLEKLDKIRTRFEAIKAKNPKAYNRVNNAINKYEVAIIFKDPELLKEAQRLLQLTTKDAPKLLKAAGADWIDTINQVMKQSDDYVRSDTSSPYEWWRDLSKAETSEGMSAQRIRQKAQDLVRERIKELTDKSPDYVKKLQGDELMQALRDRFDDDYIRMKYGVDKLDDFLSVEKVEDFLKKEEVAKQKEINEIQERIERRESDISRYSETKFKKDNPEFQKLLDDIKESAKRQQEADKKLLIQVKERTKITVEPVKILKPGENLPATVKTKEMQINY